MSGINQVEFLLTLVGRTVFAEEGAPITTTQIAWAQTLARCMGAQRVQP